MENKLDVLTKKLYEEGIGKANAEAEKIVAGAKEQAARLVAEAEEQARGVREAAAAEADGLKRKAESEMALSARQALTALKQEVTDLVTGQVAGEMAKEAFRDKEFVQGMMTEIIRKWDAASGTLDLDVVLPEAEKAKFEAYVASKCKDLLDKGLAVRAGGAEGEFVIQPKDGGYRVAFSEELFEAFFNRYMRSFVKGLLYK